MSKENIEILCTIISTGVMFCDLIFQLIIGYLNRKKSKKLHEKKS